MKIRKIMAWVLAIVFVMVLAGCSTRLSGTYTAEDELLEQSITFDDDEITISAMGLDISGTYEIKDGKIIVTYELLGLSYDMEMEFEKKGKSIFIDGTEYVKQ